MQHDTARRRSARRTITIAIAVAIAIAMAAVQAAPAAAANGWWDGNWSSQSGTNCSILGSPYTETMTQNAVGYWVSKDASGTPDGSYPAVGDRYWGRMYTGVVGNTCGGGIADVGTQFTPPPNTVIDANPASSDPNEKVRCFGYSSSKNQWYELTDQVWQHPGDPNVKGKYCDSTVAPQQDANGRYSLGYRLLAQGQQFFVMFPLRTTKQLKGSATSTDKGIGRVYSGVNTEASPFQWFWVADRPVSIVHPADAESALTDTTAKTKATVWTWYRTGKVRFQIWEGTGAAPANPVTSSYDVASAQGYNVEENWNGLTPGTDYSWRVLFVDDRGTPSNTADDLTTHGAQRTFKTTGTRPAEGGGTPTGGTGGTGTTPTDGTTGGEPSTGDPSSGGSGSGSGSGDTGSGSGSTGDATQGSTAVQPSNTAAAQPQQTTTEPAVSSPDVRPPTVRATAPRVLSVRTLLRRPAIGVRCSEACRISVRLVATERRARRAARRGPRTLTLATGTARMDRAGTRRVRLAPSRQARGLGRRMLATVRPRATLVVTTVDAAGNRTVVRRNLALRR